MTLPFARAAGARARDTADSLEIRRIVSLPIVELPTPEEADAFCQIECQAEWLDKGFRLFDTQVAGVLAYDIYGGGLFPIGVGWGKTAISLMIANRAFERDGIERTALFVPSQVWPQLTKTDIGQVRSWVGLRVPIILMGGKTAPERKAIAKSGKKGLYILPYTLLSTKDAEEVLSAIAPGLIILDEAHNVKNATAARTKRLVRYLHQRQPRLVAMSGTITSKSVNDYHHLISHALGELSPLPMEPALASNWSIVLDADADPSDAQTGPITPLIEWCREKFPDEKIPAGVPGFRAAYRRRLNTAPGVVSTGDAQIGTSLLFENLPAKHHEQAEGFATLKRYMDDVEELWRTPSGDEIEFAFHKWRHLYELSSGFFYHLRWPSIAEITKGGRLTEEEALGYLQVAQEHHVAQQQYHRDLRRWLEYQGRPGLDTPLLVASNMARRGSDDVGGALFNAWRAVKDLEFEGMPERISEPVRICDYKILHIVEWAAEHATEGGLIWFWHDEMGRWIHEYLEAAGLDSLWCPSESVRKGANERVLDARNKGRILVVSMGGHGTGKNLQHFQTQLFAQYPRKADLLEQVIGRTHRNGQQADELVVHTINTLTFDHLNTAAALVDALYIHQTMGARQKAIYASYNPLPKMYPTDFLRERGFRDVAQLDAEARARLVERFGPLEAA